MDSFSFENEEEDNVILDFVYMIPIYIFINAYTVVTIFSVTRSTYISGDLLSGKNINDNISLMKTIKLFCKNALVVIYCNFYYFKIFAFKEIKYGVSVFMVVKIVIIIVFAIFTCKVKKFFFLFKNDLKDYNSIYTDKNFDEEEKRINFNILLIENKKIVDYLESK